MTTKSRSEQRQKTELQETTGHFELDEEVKTFDAHLPGWADREGQYVLIKGRNVLGFYPRHEDALEAGYDQFDGGPFLVKQILAEEPIYQLGQVEF
jgi:hypothetical protein